MTKILNPQILFDCSEILDTSHFQVESIFELLGKSLSERIVEVLTSLGVENSPVIKGTVHPSAIIEGPVYIDEGAIVGPTAYIIGPTYIGKQCEVRHGAYIRGGVYAASHSVIGHTTEVKGSIFGQHAKAGHFAYVGDSLLGDHVNLGAGTKLANLKLRGNEVKVADPETSTLISSGLRKLGAILGKHSQTGCNAVLSPGTVLMPSTAVLPCVHYRGTLSQGVAR